MALRTLYLPSALKYDFGEVDEEMFESDVTPCELIFYRLDIQKRDLHNVALVMFHVGEWT
jgi:hypothetical protein